MELRIWVLRGERTIQQKAGPGMCSEGALDVHLCVHFLRPLTNLSFNTYNPVLDPEDMEMAEAQFFPSGSSGSAYGETCACYIVVGPEIDLMGKDWLLPASLWHFEHIRERHLFWTDATAGMWFGKQRHRCTDEEEFQPSG